MSTFAECKEEIRAFGYTVERRGRDIGNIHAKGFKVSFPYPGYPENEFAAIYNERHEIVATYRPLSKPHTYDDQTYG